MLLVGAMKRRKLNHLLMAAVFTFLLVIARVSRSFVLVPSGANAASRRAMLGGIVLCSAPLAADAEDQVQTASSPVSVGLTGDDLVYPRWFAGNWATLGELYKVETGPLGETALSVALPGTPEALRRNNNAVGMDAAAFRARRLWKPTERSSPEGGPGAEEDRGGLPAGAAAAAYALGGPAPKLKPKADGIWEVGGRWKMQAAGAVARADPEIPGGLRVSELFEVRPLNQDTLSAAVRVVTIWREASADGSEQLQLDLRDLGEPDKARGKLLQAVQVAYLLQEPSSPSEKNFGSVTTRFVYTPIRA
mmetsp:Transcript_19786/g.37242  ORF Transcript_19786/g.37242 Transcript_19786/m.37242 type:complete len:306 (+) Transcript_19786:26-943(+)